MDLILLTVAGVVRSRQAAKSLICSENLLHVGRMLQAYTQINHDFIPPSSLQWHSTRTGKNGRYTYADALVESNLGIRPTPPAMASAKNQPAIAHEFGLWFRCPSATRPVTSLFGVTYACNPNAFWRVHDRKKAASGEPGAKLDQLRDIPRPAGVIAVGDANQNAKGDSCPAFDWLRYGRLDDSFEPTRRIPIGGTGGSGNKDGMAVIGPGDSGLRYRHISNVIGTPSANVLFFDGHVTQIQINHLRQMDVAASY
jgi:prepilin-type processing-associated H-X9-DG protein